MGPFHFCQLDRLLRISAFGYNLKSGIAVKDIAPGLPDQFMVVGNQNIDLAHIGLF